MCVAGVACDEDPRKTRPDLLLWHVVKLVAETLPDLVYRPPADVFDLNLVRVQDPIRDLGQLPWGDTPVVEHLFVADLVQLDIEPDQVSTLARDDEDVALICR